MSTLQERLGEARRCINSKKFKDALAHLKEALKLDKKSHDTFV
jgi:hypothetical protein